MNEKQFQSREEFEKYLADPRDAHETQAKALRQASFRKSLPFAIGGFCTFLGVLLFIQFPSLFGDNRSSAERTTDRFSTVASWFGLDLKGYHEQQKRELEEQLQRIRNARPVVESDIAERFHRPFQE